MSVQLIIDGNTVTDVLAQVQDLARATGVEAPSKNVAGATSGQTTSTASAPSNPQNTTSSSTTKQSPSTSTGGETKPKTLTREEQDAAVEEMIANGETDGRFDQLTKGRQKAVNDGIAAKQADIETGSDANLDDMFGDDDAVEEEIVVTGDTIREMMGKLGKDAKGQPVQENLLKIRDILTRFVPKGEEIKVGKIPEADLPAVYAELKKLEA